MELELAPCSEPTAPRAQQGQHDGMQAGITPAARRGTQHNQTTLWAGKDLHDHKVQPSEVIIQSKTPLPPLKAWDTHCLKARDFYCCVVCDV